MRTTVLILSIFILGVGCSRKEQVKGSNNDTVKETKKNNSQLISEDNIKSIQHILNDSSQYIGFIEEFYFSHTKEAYIELCSLNDKIHLGNYEDSNALIYRDDDNARFKVPYELSSKYFDLRGLAKLKIFDKDNNFLCNAEFKRVEYLHQNISPVFIAVYKIEKKIKPRECYAISNIRGEQKQINYTVSEDSALTNKILKRLNDANIDPYFKADKHIHNLKQDTIISIVQGGDFAYITMLTNIEFKVFYKSSRLENFAEIFILPLTSHNLPHILARNTESDSDIFWDNLLIYDGKKYTIAHHQRIKQ